MPGNLFYFCSEWQRTRKVVTLDTDALREVAQVLGRDGYMTGPCAVLEKNGLQGGWHLDPAEAFDVGLLTDLGKAPSPPPVPPDMLRGQSARGAPVTELVQPRVRATRSASIMALSGIDVTPPTAAAPAIPSPRGVQKSPRRNMVSGDRNLTLPPYASLQFISNDHPMASIPMSELTKEEFSQEVQKRLKAERLFADKPHQKETPGPLLSTEELEDIFDCLLLMQKPTGLTGTPTVNMGRSLDIAVDGFFSLCRLRQIIERGASSTTAFFKLLDLDQDKKISQSEVRRIFKSAQSLGAADSELGGLSVGDFTASADSLAEQLMVALDLNKDNDVDLWEMLRQVAIAAPPRMALIELVGHFEMKYGHAKCGFSSGLDRHQFYEYLTVTELLDLSPEEAMRCFRLAVGKRQELAPADFEKFLRFLPLEVTWGVEPLVSEQLHCALGTRALQMTRRNKQDGCLPHDALSLEKHDLDSIKAKTPGAEVQELTARFDRLYDKFMIPSLQSTSGNLGKRLREACLRCFLESGTELRPKADRGAMPSSPRGPLQAKVARHGPVSLFPNIGDVLTIPYTRLHAGQSCVVRYRLSGTSNFWSAKHTVMRNEREPVQWPVARHLLGDTPFIGLVPRGLSWSAGGGGGFYLGSQAFSKVDPKMRGDLPRDSGSGLPSLYGIVTLIIPSLTRTSRSTDGGATEDFELRLFCAKNHKIVGCIGEPLFVEVLHQVKPPPMASLQVLCEGAVGIARWAPMRLGMKAPGTVIETIRVHMESDKQERTLTLDPEVDEWEVRDLLPESDYEVRVRFENRAGHSREASFKFRTNALCSAPIGLACAASSTTQVELRWHHPKILGNEVTKDRYQEAVESVQNYKCCLRVYEDASEVLSEPEEIPEDGLHLAAASVVRECRWTPNQWRESGSGDITARLASLRPDTQYILEGMCAVNSMGPGASLRSLTFWTVPHTPRIAYVKFHGGLVFVGLAHSGGVFVKDFSVSVLLANRDPEVKKTFELTKSDLREESDGVSGLALPFDAQPMAEITEMHTVSVRAKNEGGWSESSKPYQTQVIARQQGAEQAQTALIRAIEARRIDDLNKVLTEGADIEFPEPKYVEEATQLLHRLQAVRHELQRTMQARDPGPMRKALTEAEEVRLPDLGKAQSLLKKLEQVVHKLDTAEGIDALKVALKAAHQARLPPEMLTNAVARLGTREATEEALVEAMAAARVPGLLAALEAAEGMRLPSEAPAQSLLHNLLTSQQKLQSAVERAIFLDLEEALEHADSCGLMEEDLINEAKALMERLLEEQEASCKRLKAAINERHPKNLHQALADARRAQVKPDKLAEGEAVLKDVEDLLQRVADAVGVTERRAAMQAAREASVPSTLLLIAEGQLDSLINLRGAIKDGRTEKLRRRLRAAENAGAKSKELLEARVVYRQWLDAEREVDVAVALGQTERLRVGLLSAMSIGISEQQLTSFIEAFHAMEKKDAVYDNLLTAIKQCKCEQLQKAVRVACDAGVGDTSVEESHQMYAGRLLIQKLLALRSKLAFAIEQGELKSTWEALEAASKVLPRKEYGSIQKLLSDIQQKEKEGLTEEISSADRTENFRALDAIINQCRALMDYGVQVDDLDAFAEQSGQFQAEVQARLENDLQVLRTDRSYPQKPKDLPENAINGTMVELPVAVIRGGLSLQYVPPGTFQQTLPREIIEGKLKVVMPASHTIEGVESVYDYLLRALRRLLAPQDEVKVRSKANKPNDNGDGVYDLQFAIYVRAAHHGLEITEALCERGHLGGDLWEDEEEGSCIAAGLQKVHSAEEKEAYVIEEMSSAITAHLMEAVTPKPIAEPLDSWGNPDEQRWRRLSDHVEKVRPRWLRRVTVELGWTYNTGERANSNVPEPLDATCFVFSEEQLLEVIDHRGTHGLRYGAVVAHVKGQTSADMTLGAVRHGGDTTDAERRGGKQTINVRLDLLPPSAVDIIFTLSVYNGKDLSRFKELRAVVYDTDTMTELVRASISGSSLKSEAVIMCTLYRMPDDLWHFNSHHQTAKGNARDYKPVLNKLLSMGFPRISGMRKQVPAILSGVRRCLGIDWDPKATSVQVAPTTCLLDLRFVVELFSRHAKAEDILETVYSLEFRKSIVQALQKESSSRFTASTLQVRPATFRNLINLRIDLKWDFLPQEPGQRFSEHSAKEGGDFGKLMENYMDGSCHLFEGQALREVIDYRGPHGVRIVCNGVLDYGGVWIGKVGVGDASAGSIQYMGEKLDSLQRTGTQSFAVQLDHLPDGISDIFLALSSPMGLAVANFKRVQVVLSDGDDYGHVLATRPMDIDPCGQEDGDSLVLACLSRRRADDTFEFHSYNCRSQGQPADFRPLHLTLRAMQEKRHLAPEWPHLVPADRGKKLGARKFHITPELSAKRAYPANEFTSDLYNVLLPPEISQALTEYAGTDANKGPKGPSIRFAGRSTQSLQSAAS